MIYNACIQVKADDLDEALKIAQEKCSIEADLAPSEIGHFQFGEATADDAYPSEG